MQWNYAARVVRVVDGDTVDLEVDLGFRQTFTDRFRLFGVDCPERGQVGWSEAKQFVETRLPVGAEVQVTTLHPKVRDPRDGFGRWLATIEVDGYNLNDALVTGGFAVPYKR